MGCAANFLGSSEFQCFLSNRRKTVSPSHCSGVVALLPYPQKCSCNLHLCCSSEQHIPLGIIYNSRFRVRAVRRRPARDGASPHRTPVTARLIDCSGGGSQNILSFSKSHLSLRSKHAACCAALHLVPVLVSRACM